MYWVAIYPLDQIKSAMATDSIIVSQRKYPTMAITAQVSFRVGACFVHSKVVLRLPLQGIALRQQVPAGSDTVRGGAQGSHQDITAAPVRCIAAQSSSYIARPAIMVTCICPSRHA